jgi:hypothetical protein
MAQPRFPQNCSDPAKILPYLVPPAYLAHHEHAPIWPLGHDIHIVLVHDQGELAGNVTDDDLKQLRLSADGARKRALGNLEQLARGRQIGMRLFDDGPQGLPFMLVGGHWTAAAMILMPGLAQRAAKHLNSEELCFSIPNRETLITFPKGNQAQRDAMVEMIKEKEAGHQKPLTYRLFERNGDGVRPLES